MNTRLLCRFLSILLSSEDNFTLPFYPRCGQRSVFEYGRPNTRKLQEKVFKGLPLFGVMLIKVVFFMASWVVFEYKMEALRLIC